MWKHQAGEAQKKVTQLESADRAKDARYFEEMEKMKAIIRNERGRRLEVTKERDSFQNMVQTLEHQLQQQKDRTDKFMIDWQNREEGWRQRYEEIKRSRDQWENENQCRKQYTQYLAVQMREAAHEAQKMVEKVEKLLEVTTPFGNHGMQLLSFLDQARDQYKQFVRFYETNDEMLNRF